MRQSSHSFTTFHLNTHHIEYANHIEPWIQIHQIGPGLIFYCSAPIRVLQALRCLITGMTLHVAVKMFRKHVTLSLATLLRHVRGILVSPPPATMRCLPEAPLRVCAPTKLLGR